MIIRVLGEDLGAGSDAEGVVRDLRMRLADEFDKSRFALDWRKIDSASIRRTGDAELRLKRGSIRLADAKEYCGNHPCACEIGNPKHRHGRYLEGADWVEFNDRLNNVLDAMGVSANVESAVCVVRKGMLRRIVYREGHRPLAGNYEWDKCGLPEHYGNYVGREAPRSEFPEGTPGIYGDAYNVVG